MASIANDGNTKRLLFTLDGKRFTVRLGSVNKKQAEQIRTRVETLVVAYVTKTPVDADTAAWVAGIGDELANRIAKTGLIPPRSVATLSEFTQGYINRRTDVKPNTRKCLKQARDRLFEILGNPPLRSVTPADADRFVIAMKELGYAKATIGRTTRRARQYFRAAVRAKLIPSNPFEDVKSLSQTNDARKFFIDRETTQRVIDACPNAEWKLIVALCRYGGIRCPSELIPLRWVDVDWQRGRFLVHSPKTEHNEGGESRWVPIFPELLPYLESVWNELPHQRINPEQNFVIQRYRDPGCNLRTQLQRIMKRAGVPAWERLFQNLRASRETELTESFPLHVVCAWIGNSAIIASKHYLQVTEDHFQAAQKAAQTATGNGGQGEKTPGSEQAADAISRLLSPYVGSCREDTTARRGVETLVVSDDPATGLQVRENLDGAKSVANLLLSLPPSVRVELAGMLAKS